MIPCLTAALFLQYSPKLMHNVLKWLHSLDLAAPFYSPDYFINLGDGVHADSAYLQNTVNPNFPPHSHHHTTRNGYAELRDKDS